MEYTEDIRFILGRPNFWCGAKAIILRQRGHEIPRKAEDEQAYVIYWMLNMYKLHGGRWKKACEDYLNGVQETK